jgi:hypothetical protein
MLPGVSGLGWFLRQHRGLQVTNVDRGPWTPAIDADSRPRDRVEVEPWHAAVNRRTSQKGNAPDPASR